MLQLKNVTKSYPGVEKPAVDNINITIQAGEFVSLVGRSGSGKSTLLHIMASLILPDSGQILLQGQDICSCSEKERNRLRRDVFAVVFQQHHLMPYLSAIENVLLPFMGGFAPVTEQNHTTAKQMLELVGLAGKENSPPGKLSGGEQQRVAIARALARGARILFADEPTGSLDSGNGAAIMELLHELNKNGVTIVMVTHNPEYAKQGHRAIALADGKIITA